ncbi:MAG: Hpt domain-containing protein, partial [Gemmatimonadales bacterium]
MDVARYAQLFLADSREQLRAAASLLVDWEQNPEATDGLPELFRAFHSVKGAAAAMGYDSVTRLAHSAESLLDAIREERLAPSGPVVGLLLRSVEVLELDAEAAVRGESIDDAPALAEALARMAASGDTPVVARPSGSRRAPRPSGALAAPQGAQSRMVRIEPARLDDLLLRAGELMVGWNRLERSTRHLADPAIEAVVGALGSLVRNNHASVLRARLAPVEELFDRFPRIVRDLGASLDRSVRLERPHQDEIELDRGMLEALVDPLVHLVRNAVDHGIEPPTERSLRGKPDEGTVSIWATRDREWVTINLADDGRGIDRDRVVERAIEMGLRGAGDPAPSAEELLTLLARPGFTMKQAVSEVSGRGVGMDVVVTTI